MLDTNWNLDNLYTSINSDEYKKDKQALENKINDITSFLQNETSSLSTVDFISTYIEKVADTFKYAKVANYVFLFVTTSTTNAEYLKDQESVMKILNKFALPETLFKKYISNISNLDELISKNDSLKPYKLFLTETKEQSVYALSEGEEVLLSKLKETGSRAYDKLRDSYISTLLVDVTINGAVEQVTFSALRNLAYSPDPAVRKEALEREIEALGKIEKTVAACLNGIKGEVINVSELRGYSSPLEFTLKSQRMDEKTLETMLTAMREFLPEFERYYTKKAEILGHKNGLPFYDLFAPVGESNLKYTYEEAHEYIVNSFNEFSSELGEYADFAFKNRWIDALPKANKREGAFCSNIQSIGESRILSNFGGDLGGLMTLAHELGHGYHGECLKNEHYLHSDYPMPLAETASIFCETIIKNNALKSASKEDKIAILENSLQDSSQVIVDILSRFTFEDNVFKNRPNGSLTPEELNDFMIDAQKQAYGKGLDWDCLHKYMWIVKGHYYDADYNYYNFPYAFGLLFATGVYAIYQNEPEGFIEKYKQLLRDTGKMNIYDCAKSVGIDLHDIEFYRGSFKVIKQEIDEFVSL